MLSDHGSRRQQPALASSQTQPREEPKTKDAAPHHAPSAPLRGKRVAGSHTQEVRQSVGQRSGWGEGSSGRRLRMGILQGSEGLGGQEAGGPGRNQGLNCWEAGIRDGSQEDKERVSGASAPRGPQSKDLVCQQAVPRETQITGLQLWALANYALGFQTEPWPQLPSADGTELAGLSTGKQRPEEALSTQLRTPASQDLTPKAGPLPRPTQSKAPRPSPAGGRERDREAEQRQRQEAQSKVPQKHSSGWAAQWLAQRPNIAGGAELSLNHRCESFSRPGGLQLGVTLPFPHPGLFCTARGLIDTRVDIAACTSARHLTSPHGPWAAQPTSGRPFWRTDLGRGLHWPRK